MVRQPRRHAGDGRVCQQHGVPGSGARRAARAGLALDRGHLCQTQLDAARLDRPDRSPAGQEQPCGGHEPGASGRPDLRPGRFLRAVAGDQGRVSVQRPAAGTHAEHPGDDRPRGPADRIDVRPGHLPALADADQAPSGSARAVGHDGPAGDQRPVLPPGHLQGPDRRAAGRGEVPPRDRRDVARQSHADGRQPVQPGLPGQRAPWPST